MLFALPLAAVAGGTILQPTSLPVAGAPQGPVAVDLDGDGDLDVALAQKDLDRIAVFLRAPDGSLVPTGVHPVGRAPVAVAAGDLDGDGRADLVVANENGPAASVLLGDGAGSFVPGAACDLPFAYAVELADLNGDAVLDVVAALPGGLSFLEGVGDGSFLARVDLSVGGAVANFALAHVDADALLDVVVGANLGGAVLLLNDGSFAFTQSVVPLTFGPFADWVATADVDEDGDTDVAFIESDAFDTCPSVRLGNGDGTFGTYAVIELEIGSFQRLAFARVDGDHDPDAVSVAGASFRVRFGAAGALFSSTIESHALGGAISGLIAADLDGDGLDEIVATSAAAGELVVYANELCASTPVVNSAGPTAIPALASDPVQLSVSGCGLDLVTGVVVAGAPLAADEYEVQGPGQLLVQMPPAVQLGPAGVVLQSPGGDVEVSAEYVATDPLLVLGNGGALADGLPTPLQAGGAPDDLMLLFASPALVPSSAPGLVELAIGDAFSSLFLLATLTLPGASWTELAPAFTGLPPGLEVHFQGASVASGQTSPPLLSTNVVTGLVVR